MDVTPLALGATLPIDVDSTGEDVDGKIDQVGNLPTKSCAKPGNSRR
jgi:hypothetical protein